MLRSSRSAGPSRRQALLAAGAGALAGCAARTTLAAAPPAPPGPAPEFRHGVASGDPLQDRVILWTRITPPDDRAVDVSWRIARDPGLTEVVAQGTARAEPARDFTVKVDAGGLAPGETYHYAFDAGGARSPVGRTRTLPQGPTERFSLAVVSCSNYPAGFFNVYRDIADRGDADVVVHLGDYIYEQGAGGYATSWGAKNGRVPDPPHEIVTLSDYRRRHALYKEDKDLQDAHAAAPWIVAWDDHESANDSYVDGAENHQPETEGSWSDRKAAAIQAYMEWTPIREPEPGRAREAIWRSFELGDLGTLVMLETRLTARSPSLQWSAAGVPDTADPGDPGAREAVDAYLRDVVGDPGREMLGAAQEAWVEETLALSVAQRKPWQVLGNQTLLAPFISPDYMKVSPQWLRLLMRWKARDAYAYVRRSAFRVPLNLDQWDGYPAARERLYAAAARSGAQLLALAGDSHMFWVNRLETRDGRRAGVELGTSAVSSPSPFVQIPDIGVDFGRLAEEANPHVLHNNGRDRGYVALTLTPAAARAELRRVATVHERVPAETYKTYDIVRGETGELEISEAGVA